MGNASRLVARCAAIVKDAQVRRYLLAGLWNTAFGYGAFAGLYRLLGERVPLLAVAGAANVVSITCAFLSYKLFVFRTRGGWLREYLRCYVVYGASALLGMALLTLFHQAFGLNAYLAQALAMGICVGVSFVGHRSFSFRGS